MNKQGMATRNSSNGTHLLHTTDFTLHKSQQRALDGLHDKVIDYTERRLIRIMNAVTDQQQKLMLAALISDYVAGHVAVAWRRGNPIHVKVTKST